MPRKKKKTPSTEKKVNKKVQHKVAQYSHIDYQEALLTASKSMIRVRDPIILLKLITRFVDRQIGATHVGVLLYDDKRDFFVLIDSKGEAGKKMPVGYVRIENSNPLAKYFTEKRNGGTFARKEAIVLNELEHLRNYEIHVSKKENAALEIEAIREEMQIMRASVCVPSYYKRKLVGLMLLGDKLSGEKYVEKEIKLFATLANDVAMAVTNAGLIKDLRNAYEKEHQLLIETASALVRAIDARDRYTRGHSERVSHYTMVIASEMMDRGIVPKNREFLEAAQLSGLLHDVGKIGIKDSILNKPARLENEEYDIMKAHVKIGSNIIKPVHGLTGLCDGILYHHERWDGKGYPYGLKGEEIPVLGRIVSIVDSYDTMVTERPYCKAMTPEEACQELERCSGSQFDPRISEIFCTLVRNGKTKKRFYMGYGVPLRSPGA